jgi:uncharacterized protein (TIGR02118 family)
MQAQERESEMARMVVVYQTPEDVDAFSRHYFETHAPLARKLPASENMR